MVEEEILMFRKIFLLFMVLAVLALSSSALAQNETVFPGYNVSKQTPLPINVSVASSKRVCLFFISAPSFVPQDEMVFFYTVNMNCGNQPIDGTTSIEVRNSTGSLMNHESKEIFMNNSLERRPFNMFWSASVPNGTYKVTAETSFGNQSINRTKTFDVLKAARNLTRRVTVWTPRRRVIRLDISLPERKMNVSRGNTLLAPVKVTNKGTITLKNVSIAPTVPSGWNSTPAYIQSLKYNQTVSRNIGLKPSKKVRPARYMVLLEGIYRNDTLDRDYLIVSVRRAGKKNLKLEEFPITFEARQRTPKNYSALVRNTGNLSLHDVTIKFENEEDCLYPVDFPEKEELKPDESTTLTTELTPRNVIRTCNVTVIATSKEKAIATGISTINVRRRMGFPATLLNQLINFVTKHPLLVIMAIILVIGTIRGVNYMRYRYAAPE